MKALIVYDSAYGNTEKIAQAIAGVFSAPHEIRTVRVGEANPSVMQGAELLIVGSPTQGGRPTPAVQGFLARIPAGSLKSVSVASFDTRVSFFLVRLFGFAAGRIAKGLTAKGARVLVPPRGFIVKGSKGPLAEGELRQAAVWAEAVIEKHKSLQSK